MSKSKRRILQIVSIAICTFSLIGLLIAYFVAGSLIAARPASAGLPPVELSVVDVEFKSESKATIRGWGSPVEQSRGVVILLHGIRSTRRSMIERAIWLRELGYSTLLIDLQAHGESSGDNITIGYLEKFDVRAAVQFVKKNYPGQPVAVIGVSLGGASAVLGSPLGIDAMILESVYPDIQRAVENRVSAKLGPFATIPSFLLLAQLQPRLGITIDQLRPVDHIADIGCPVYVISGRLDHHTPAEETLEMYETAIGPKKLWLVDGAAHVDLFAYDRAGYIRNVGQFLEQHMKPQ